MGQTTTRRPGRPAAASRDDALALARRQFLDAERVDIKAIAGELGLGRATMHRWFGTREELLGEMLATLTEERLAASRSKTGGRGAAALLSCFDRYNRELAATKALGVWLAQEQDRALRVLTSSGGIVQPRVVAAVERLISAEIDAGAFTPSLAPPTLAYAIVRLAEAFLYNDAMFGIRGDTERLREVEAALLGLTPDACGPARSAAPSPGPRQAGQDS
jgi:AcrR family transcriptional regulator